MGSSYQKGWVRLRGKKWYGYFRRTELDPATDQPKPRRPGHPWTEDRDVEVAGQGKTRKRDSSAGKTTQWRQIHDQWSCHLWVVREPPLPAT